MKKLAQLVTTALLIFSITLGYAGVPVFKMICKAEAGKVVVSIINPDDQCEHHQPEKPSCCHKEEKQAPCCDFSHHTVQLKDESLPTGDAPILKTPVFITYAIVWPYVAALLPASIASPELPRPPLLNPNIQSRLSHIQVYLI